MASFGSNLIWAFAFVECSEQHLFHANVELLKADASIVVFVYFVHDFLEDTVVVVAIVAEVLLELLHGNASISIGIQQVEDSPDVVTVNKSPMVNGSLHELVVVNCTIAVDVALLHDLIDHSVNLTVLVGGKHLVQLHLAESFLKLLSR